MMASLGLRRGLATTTLRHHRACLLSTQASRSCEGDGAIRWTTAAAVAASALLVAGGAVTIAETEAKKLDIQELQQDWNQFHLEALQYSEDDDEDEEEEDEESSEENDDDDLPTYRSSDVAKHDGKQDPRIWMAYGGMVYDVTDFIPSHPGGSQKILLGAGQSIEPYWNLYRQHFQSDLPMQYLEKMVIGKLHEDDQAVVDDRLASDENSNDPYGRDPPRHPALHMHGDQPANAECPKELLTQNYLTPNELFYIRSHQPVPYLTPQELDDFRLTIHMGDKQIQLSLEELKQLPKKEITATLQCSGNRRSHYNEIARTSGTGWEQGAISTATWGGVALQDVLKHCGLLTLEEPHVQFSSLDDFHVSIPTEKAMDKDTLIAYEMNGEPLPRDHGFPLRAIVPGYIGVRNCKWLQTIRLQPEEADSPYQRGLNYKILPVGVTDAKAVDLTKIPSMYEASVFSGITSANTTTNTVHVQGWAWAGGGRGIARVDVTCDGGQTWIPATVDQGGDQPLGRAWAWVFWSAEVPVDSNGDAPITLHSKAIDVAYNSQPEDCRHLWNLRGLANNAWYKFVVPSN